MANNTRKEIYSEDLPIDQKKPVNSIDRPEVVYADKALLDQDYLNELNFNEEPVTIRLDPSTDSNAPSSIPIWVNGKGCEVLVDGKWLEFMYIPVGAVLTIKRKYLAVLIAAKQDKVTTHFGKPGDENPINEVKRFTSSYQAFQVIEDKSPKGMSWLTEMRRRNF